MEVVSLRSVEDSPFDALLDGWACPHVVGSGEQHRRGVLDGPPGAYRLATWLSDARRLPREVQPGRVLAVSVAGFAPRPFLASSPVRDSNFEVSGVKDVIAAAAPIYALYGKSENLQVNYPDCAHDFPPDVRKVAYEFFDWQFEHMPTGE